MLFRYIAVGAAGLIAVSAPAAADPADQWNKKQWEKRADCEKKLDEAKSRRDFYKVAAECDRELAKLDREQRIETAKAWREAEKKWRERSRDDDGPYDRWDD